MKNKKINKTLEISEKFFETETDPEQIPINKESEKKILSISKDTILYKFDENQNPIAWTVVIPTSIDTMNKFLKGEMSEKNLMEVATIEKKFEALYLCAVFVIPEHRKKGYAKKLLLKSIKKLQTDNNTPLYYWAYSEEGKCLADNLSKSLNREIKKLS